MSEKPLATELEHLSKLERVVDRTGTQVSAMLDMRLEPEIRTVRDVISRGLIGEPILATAQKSYKFGNSRPWFYKRLETYGGTIPWIGIHAIFGAFLMGAVIPHDSRLAHALEERIENLVTILLLPAFFAFAGMRTEIGLISNWTGWLTCGAIIVVATIGKFGGTLASARLAGHEWRTATGLGVLMNTRGLMELIVLNVGLDLGVISPALFTMMVVMALVTTMATTPVLRMLVPEATLRRASISPQPSS